MYVWLGICVALALLFVVYTVASMIVAMSWRLLDRRSAGWSESRRANLLFGLRVLPAAVSVLFVGCLAGPAYLLFEPYETDEELGLKLVAIAALGLCGIVYSAHRTLSSWLQNRRLTAEWMRAARPTLKLSIPAYRFEHGFPLMAVSGILRPRLFIAKQLLDCMQPEELSAAIRHEMSHLEAGDNLRRFILRMLPNAAGLFGARGLDAAWSEAAEMAADARAARSGPRVALDLASALIKAARIAPVGVTAYCSPLLSRSSRSALARRVQRLTALAAGPGASLDDARETAGWSKSAALLGFALLSAFWMSLTCLHAAHELIEVFVRLLS